MRNDASHMLSNAPVMSVAHRILIGIACSLAAILLGPHIASALSIDHAIYGTENSIAVTCTQSANIVYFFDVTSGGEVVGVGPYACNSSISDFEKYDGHSYRILEIKGSASCDGLSYDTCAYSGVVISEVDFVVSTSGSSGGGVSSPTPSTNKTVYAPTDTVAVTCSYSRNTFAIFDVTTSGEQAAVGQFDCGSPATPSFPMTTGHSYAILELPTNATCSGLSHDSCASSGFVVHELNFSVSSSGGTGEQTLSYLGASRSTYEPGDQLEIICSYSRNIFYVFDITLGGGASALVSSSCGTPATPTFSGADGHQYAILELTSSASCAEQSYDSCLNAGSVVRSYGFVVAYIIHSATVESFRPTVTVLAPEKATIFSRQGLIEYRATDKNDRGGFEERTRLGLTEKPVSLYYTDKLPEWDHTLTPLEDMVLIAANQPASGMYAWKIKDLVPGVFYRAVVTAIDMVGNVGQDVSDFFTVDFESPDFTVVVDPPVTRSDTVTITIISSKDLVGTPTTTVTQQGGTPVVIAMEGSDREFIGSYTVAPGYDGIATVTVEGVDRVGNVGSTILSGGTFAVGVNPPPAPVILAPKVGTVSATSSIELSGTTRPDTTVLVKANGVLVATLEPDSQGNFATTVSLNAESRRGINILSVAAKDATGVTGSEASIEVKYNLPPFVALSSPKNESVVGSTVAIQATSTDRNFDPLLYTYQIIPKGLYEVATSSDREWITIGDGIPSNRLNWDTTEVDDGSYFLRVVADDGLARATTSPQLVIVKNTLPYFRFEDGRRTITGTSSAVIRGRAITPASLTERPVILNADYSVDDGKSWKPIAFTSGSSTPEAVFTVTVSGLQEGVRSVRFRVRDSRLLFGKSTHQIVFDITPPKAPIISSPRPGDVLSSRNDASGARKGMQIAITGRTEPVSTVSLTVGSTTLSTKALPDGSFHFVNIDLPVRGLYRATISSTDVALNVSPATNVDFSYDNAPQVSILQPKNLRALSGRSTVRWRAVDPDGDTIEHLSLSYRVGESPFKQIPLDRDATSYEWDLSRFPEGGGYSLQLEASDGTSKASDTVAFSIDRTEPRVKDFVLARTVMGATDRVRASGAATDSLSGIEYVEYAIAPRDSDSTSLEWYTGTITRGFLSKTASFAIDHPVRLEDGVYRMYLRAVDAAGNTSPAESREIVVDTSAPRIGGFQIDYAGLSLSPNSDGAITTFELSSGVFAISLEEDTASASLTIGSRQIPLVKDLSSGLWQAQVELLSNDHEPILVSAEDAVRNVVSNKPIGVLSTVARGSVRSRSETGTVPLKDASIEVLVLDERGAYTAHDTGVRTNENGAYELALAQGTYRIVARKTGYTTMQQEVTLNSPGVVNASFDTTKLSFIGNMLQTVTELFR